jgi:hypothetical protein
VVDKSLNTLFTTHYHVATDQLSDQVNLRVKRAILSIKATLPHLTVLFSRFFRPTEKESVMLFNLSSIPILGGLRHRYQQVAT